MSNEATVKLSLDGRDYESGVSRAKAGMKALSATAKAESARAMDAMKAISTLELKQARAEKSGDKAGAAAIQREIDLTKELESIRRKAATDTDRIILQTQARQRKNLADEMAVTQRRRAELDEINKLAAKSLAIKQQAHQVDLKSAAVAGSKFSNIRTGNSDGFKNQRMANVAAQIQDIAVQAQMGVSPLTIIAQQGSQLIGAFGAKGALVGGGIAIGGALLSWGATGNKVFSSLISDAETFNKEVTATIRSGSFDQLSAAMRDFDKQGKSLREAGGDVGGIVGIIQGGLGIFSGGKSKKEKEADLIKAEGELFWKRAEAQTRAMDVSEQDLAVSLKRSDGYNEEAEAMERGINLARRLGEIESSAFSPEAKNQLSTDAIQGAAALELSEQKKLQEARAKSAQDFIESIEDDERKSAERRSKIDKQVSEAKIEGEQAGATIGKSDDEISQMQTGITLAKELAKINEMNASQESRDALATAAIKKATASNELLTEKKKKELAEANTKEAAREGEERASTGKLLQDAEDASVQAQQAKYSLSKRIALETAKLAQAETEAAHQAKFGSKANQNTANAKVLTTRLSLQELAQQRAAQFVGKSSKDVRMADRDDAKQKKELDKAGKRAIEADIRKADAENRQKGGLGLKDADKARMREAGNKALGKDLQATDSAAAAKSLANLETTLGEMSKKLGVAK